MHTAYIQGLAEKLERKLPMLVVQQADTYVNDYSREDQRGFACCAIGKIALVGLYDEYQAIPHDHPIDWEAIEELAGTYADVMKNMTITTPNNTHNLFYYITTLNDIYNYTFEQIAEALRTSAPLPMINTTDKSYES